MNSSRRAARWPGWVLLVPLALIGLAVFRAFLPELGKYLPSCVFFELTGKHCPGCGGTRAATALVYFDFQTSLRQNAWFTIVFLMGLPYLILAAAQQRFSEVDWLRFFRWRSWIPWLLLITMMLFFVMRNIAGFEWLAPVGAP